jgi:hypothetical protein
MDRALSESVSEAPGTLRILDGDTPVKPLYGHQDGAEISHDPKKPGRPRHVPHTFDAVEASLRLLGGSQVRRVIVLRRRVTGHLLAKGQADERPGQAPILFD